MILILVGESASGKSTLAKQFEKDNPNFSRIVTYTTRPKREGEIDTVDYHFINALAFDNMIKQGCFVEHASYRGWQYGTAINFGKDDDKIVVLTPAGARAFRRYAEAHPELNLDILVVYLNVDRRSRLIKMLQRGDDIEECTRRSLSDVGQFDSFENEADFTINNEKYINSVEDLSWYLGVIIKTYKEGRLTIEDVIKAMKEYEDTSEQIMSKGVQGEE